MTTTEHCPGVWTCPECGKSLTEVGANVLGWARAIQDHLIDHEADRRFSEMWGIE